MAEMDSAAVAVSQRVEKIFQSINAGEGLLVYESFASPKFREVVTLEQFTAICDRIKTRLGSLRSKEDARFDLNPLKGALVANATYNAKFEHGAGDILVIFEKREDAWMLLRLTVNAPELLDDPTTFEQPTVVYVEDAEPVLPGSMVDLLDISEDPPKVILQNVRVLHVRWKVDNPLTPVKAPAKGFVTIGLKADQTDAVKAIGKVSIRPHQP